MGVEGVASHHGVDENGGGFLKKCLADRQFAVVFFTTVGVHGERCPGVVVTEGDEGSEFAFAAEILAVEREAFGEEVTVGHEPLIDGIGERVRIDLVDDVVDGVVAGKEQMTAFLVAAVLGVSQVGDLVEVVFEAAEGVAREGALVDGGVVEIFG